MLNAASVDGGGATSLATHAAEPSDAAVPPDAAAPEPPRPFAQPLSAELDAAPPPTSELCGDGVVNDELEACDGRDLAGLSCPQLGYASGDLSCDPQCRLAVEECKGDESCYDGSDNDGDGLSDCDDDACNVACASSCEAPVGLDPLQLAGAGAIWLSGNTRGHASELGSACAADSDGAEVVYRVVPTNTGVLEVELESLQLMTVSISTRCSARASAELVCTQAGRSVRASTTEGEPLYVVVAGRSAEDDGAYEIRISERERQCGDGHRDEPEECDDANHTDSDGCSADCALESSEREPNDSLAEASEFVQPFFGSIAPIGDQDFVALEIPSGVQSLRISTRDLGDGACGQLMDTSLALFNEEGEQLGTDDDGGSGLCSAITLREPEAGRYTVLVEALTGSGVGTFPYALHLAFEE